MNAGATDPGSHHAPAWIVALSGIELMEQQKGGAEVVKELLADPRTIVVAGNPLPDTMSEEQRGVSVLRACNKTCFPMAFNTATRSGIRLASSET